ncbi:MAG: helical backbone metal receptor [Bryobacterales bacterium]
MTRRLALAVLALGTVASASPQRIISAAPSITEMLYALGAGPRVVAVTSFCHYPPEVRQKPKIGTYLEPNMEAILALRPDLVVILQEHGELRDQLERLGLNVMTVQHNDVAGIEQTLRGWVPGWATRWLGNAKRKRCMKDWPTCAAAPPPCPSARRCSSSGGRRGRYRT